jgi:2-keto-4-pentenoate hydratase/2-oxohepta-3-ene-1,7-dioic acid hydratase in catechol pathway
MKLARFRVNDWESFGLVEGNHVRAIHGSIFGEYTITQASYPLDRIKLLPPTRPTSFWAVGLNYAAHVAHQEVALDAERIRREASIFRPWHKGVSCIIGHNAPVVLPPEADYVHYEGELVIVIGRPDISNWRKKGSDTFGPVGPWIETDLNPHQVEIITRLNGRETDRGSTSGMTYNCYETVSGISQYVTLHPGDLILTGAPGAVEQLHPGDVVEIEIPEIGTLRNPVVSEESV